MLCKMCVQEIPPEGNQGLGKLDLPKWKFKEEKQI